MIYLEGFKKKKKLIFPEVMNLIIEMQWNFLGPLEQRLSEDKHEDYACKWNCVPVPEQPRLINSAQSFNLWQWLWTDEHSSSWLPWFLLGFVSEDGSEPRKSPASKISGVTSLHWVTNNPAMHVASWHTRTPLSLETISGRRGVTSHQVLVCSRPVLRMARFQGWVSNGRQTFSI